ncbi:MAG: transglycosylase SLT domain-containing protein [Sphaerospermopsis sp. SIO1G2]|nr:transglycosylase SLT domain-containing protein [Sphaerospermopsis sp. SIO1G2]
MLKKLQNKQMLLIAGAGLCAFLIGGMVSAPELGKILNNLLKTSQSQPGELPDDQKFQSRVYSLVSQSLPERAAKLVDIAENGRSPDREKARYLLASDYIETDQGRKALDLLVGLENEYPILAPYILLKQAQAHQIIGENGKASDLRRKVLKEYADQPVVVKAKYLIGLPEINDEAIAKFPSHPLTWEMIRNRLRKNPDQPELQLILAKYAAKEPGIVGVLNQLVKQPNLTPENWDLIGSVYWQNNQFAQAANAYAKAPKTAQSLYRQARSLQIGKKRDQAAAIYKQQIEQHPDDEQTGTALLRLADIEKGKAAISYLDQVIEKFPKQAPAALEKKAKRLASLKDRQSADATWKILLGQYGNSQAAAKYRWRMALDKAKNKDYVSAWQWAQPITIENKKSILAPRAGFWIGKWATLLGKQEDANAAYQYVLSQFPQSYYAWRSARILGLDVGDFSNLRLMNPEIIPRQRPVPPAGSNTFKELYLLGQDRDAWYEWETELKNKSKPTVNEQFTKGLIQLTRGQNLIGIATISKLEDRETPEEQAEYAALSKQITYWQARYPFPYFQEIKQWSNQRKLNPLLVTALMRQESRFQPKIRSIVGATGLMQVMPTTADWIAPQIGMNMKDLDLENPNDNIMLGTWYLDHTHQQYSNNSMLAIASYNAGPGNVAKWLRTIPKQDPDEFVKEIPFGETRNYVRLVFGNYWNYLRLYNPDISALVAKYSESQPELVTGDW